MYRGRVEMTAPMYWTLGFMVTFVIGGMTGVMLAIPGADFLLHNSLFLVAHFHNVIIGGVLFGYVAAMMFWFPKAFGFKLNERLGKASFWCWLVGFWMAFLPLYVLGLKGMTRRLNHYDNPEWHPWLIVAWFGAVIIAAGIFFLILQIAVSIKDRKKNMDLTGDPWGGRTLEWSTASPTPFYNFAHVPHVDHLEQFWEDKEAGRAYKQPTHYEDIHMPRNTGDGVFIGGIFGTIMGFALIWHIWWLAIIGFLGMIGTFIRRSYNRNTDYYVPAKEVEAIETARYRQLQQGA
jgi:cytochrome o ubiquinol oxidase subunit 1